MSTRRETIINASKDLMADFLYYSRKEDEDLPVSSIEGAIKNDEISIEEILAIFKKELESSVCEQFCACGGTAYTGDLKSPAERHEGSNPSGRTNLIKRFMMRKNTKLL